MASAEHGYSPLRNSGVGCAWAIAFFLLIPFFHYLLIAFAILAVLSILPLCFRLAELISIRDLIAKALAGSCFTSSGICGVLEDAEIKWRLLWPRLALKAVTYSLEKGEIHGKQISFSIGRSVLLAYKKCDIEDFLRVATKEAGIEIHADLSPEARSIQLLTRCLTAHEEGSLKLDKLAREIEDFSISLQSCKGNPLLEPSRDNLRNLLAEAMETRRQVTTKTNDLEKKINFLKEYLSMPSTVRRSIAYGERSGGYSLDEELEHDFQELIDFAVTMDSLTDRTSL